MQDIINACFIVDDTPANATYWAQLQQGAIGYQTAETGWATRWRDMASAGFFRAKDAADFADFIEESGIRGKFTFLPCPAGLGRVDRSVRGMADNDLRRIIAIVRDRIAKQMDITPEVLTHTMPYDPDTDALLPHTETHWLSHLCVTRQTDRLMAYLRHAWTILGNVGIKPSGLTVGGMSDFSGIGQGKSLLAGDARDVLGEALLAVQRERDPNIRNSFIYTGSPPITEEGKKRRAPETIYRADDGATVHEIHSIIEDPIFPVILGPNGIVERTTDALITPDLEHGLFVEEAESGRALVFTVHCQTLIALNTGAGLQIMREACRRLRERYGKRLVWSTPLEFCAKIGV